MCALRDICYGLRYSVAWLKIEHNMIPDRRSIKGLAVPPI